MALSLLALPPELQELVVQKVADETTASRLAQASRVLPQRPRRCRAGRPCRAGSRAASRRQQARPPSSVSTSSAWRTREPALSACW